ncbi:preprotein translocase subunit SecE [Arthrobacter cryoconiti]|uniref:Protein translocase subunit SecE n=1 Tax=Arthrobacter cryoconiti TaxID=748907 RepID=A0ABV8R2I2_9MICC|nr:preprotein translocase subunit SecE [Arthrobacter cryoconiti]MCC9069189.1 preprotein translocase subunit SecE [Arthrobacter cryoconiti]
MSEAVVTESAASRSKGRSGKKAGKPGLFARIAIFLRQVIGEMKKVVTPTRQELVNYTVVVLVFVAIVMGIVTVLDFGFGKAVLWVFGGNVSVEQ